MSQATDLIEKHRSINVEHIEWWDSVYDDMTYELDKVGLTVSTNDMFFSGFWSQGDGASFTGNIERSDMKRFMDHHGLAEQYVACYYFANREELGANIIRRSHHYCHENTVELTLDDNYIYADQFDDGDPRKEIYEAMVVAFAKQCADFEEELEKICQDYMTKLYRNLEKEYEYLTSDEAVWETIEANELNEQLNHQQDEVIN